jgi:hypothetical protein
MKYYFNHDNMQNCSQKKETCKLYFVKLSTSFLIKSNVLNDNKQLINDPQKRNYINTIKLSFGFNSIIK